MYLLFFVDARMTAAQQTTCACRRLSEAFRSCATTQEQHIPKSEPLSVPQRAFLDECPEAGILLLRYPADCCCQAFQQQYSAAAERMEKVTSSFGLVHDLTQTQLLSLRVDEIASAAAAIASKGFVRRVAIVLDTNPLLRAAIAAGVFAQSPVRPARCFDRLDEACAWAGAWRDPPAQRKGLPIPDFGVLEPPPHSGAGVGVGAIQIRFRPFYSLNRLLGGQELANARAERIDFLRGFTFELVLPGQRPRAASTTAGAPGAGKAVDPNSSPVPRLVDSQS